MKYEFYLAGKMDGTPKLLACNPGTVVCLENLFYNNPVRLSAMRNSSETWKHCLECVQKFSIHFPTIGFTFKREEKLVSDLKTSANASVLDNIAACFCSEVARGVVEIECEDTKFGFKATGVASTMAYIGRTFLIFFFVNDRLVDCDVLKRSIRLLYSNYLPKHRQPFVYLSLQVSKHKIDVNLHPTKQQVSFLYEKEIVDVVLSALDNMLKNSALDISASGSNRLVQELPFKYRPAKQQKVVNENKAKRVGGDKIVRVDHKERKIEEFLEQNMSKWPTEELYLRLPDTHVYSSDSLALTKDGINSNLPSTSAGISASASKPLRRSLPAFHGRHILLTAVQRLKQEIGSQSSPDLRALFREHSFVGSVDLKYTLLQYKTGLFMIDVEKLSEELFYQITLMKFGNHEAFRFSTPCNIKKMLELALQNRGENPTPEAGLNRMFKLDDLDYAVDTVARRADMLWDYFAFEIVDKQLVSIPKLLDNYLPRLDDLPRYLLNLAEKVDWDEEENCYRTFSRETGKFYALKYRYEKCKHETEQSVSPSLTQTDDWRWLVKQLCKAFKSSFLPPEKFAKDGSIVKLTDVGDLYKLFERC
ncbi:DNA mismatch repair protein Mlh1 [Trichuris trichiura]|uniref:DNA mismatch repair protein Mlh1 n=1 Tax=Trichuris trichiura TaxID=36087 RepID=A0A077ZC15_TRITR|nr:DNA mismatch repair protein Mlh1 [Trichuris trichiura]